MRGSLALLASALLLLGCSSDKGMGEAREVRADDFGTAWPLTVETAVVSNVCGVGDPGVGVLVDGREFVIDDITSPADASTAFLRLWATDPDHPSGRKDLSPLLEAGTALCD